MDAAVAEYARWRRSPEAFMLGRFVAPAGRLVELGRAADALLPEPGAEEPWRVSALLGADVHGDAARVSSWNVSHAGRALVDCVELKAAGREDAETALDALPSGLTAFVELPLAGDLPELLAALKRRGARAKARTGGLVPEAIPDPGELARFIVACAAASVPWKATAGLHHPVRSDQALTYEPASPRATMHGFLNVFAAAAARTRRPGGGRRRGRAARGRSAGLPPRRERPRLARASGDDRVARGRAARLRVFVRLLLLRRAASRTCALG